MVGLYDEALANEAVRAADLEAERAEATRRLERLEASELRPLLEECRVPADNGAAGGSVDWDLRRRLTLERLGADHP